MKLELFRSLFAMLLSLFVTVENDSSSRYIDISKSRDIEIAGGDNAMIAKNPPHINAKSAWLGCLCGESPLYAFNPSVQLPLASVSKIMTSYLALRELGPDYLAVISDKAIETEGIAGDLRAGETFTVRDLIIMAMTYSSNDAAMALAEALGEAHGAKTFSDAIQQTVWIMNEEARVLGMQHTFFQNPTGLDISRAGFSDHLGPSNFSSAHDITKLLDATRAYPLLWDLSRDETLAVISKEGIVHTLLNLNPFRAYPHYVAGKTGTTDLAGENLVMLFERPLGKLHALILFGAPSGQREIEAQKLLDWMNGV